MPRATARWIALAIAATATVTPLAAQDLFDVSRAVFGDRDVLRAYSWTSETRLVVDGETLRVERARARFDDDGRVERDVVSVEDVGVEGGPIARRQARRDIKRAEVRRVELGELIDEYVHMGRTDAQRFAEGANPEGLAAGRRLRARDLLRIGDTVDVVVGGEDARPEWLEILTSLEGEPVWINCRFARLGGDGPVYVEHLMLRTELDETPLAIVVENSDFREIREAADGQSR